MSTNKGLALLLTFIGLMGGFLISSVTLGKETGRTLQKIETHDNELRRLDKQDDRMVETIASQFTSIHGRIDSMTEEIITARIQVATLQTMIEELKDRPTSTDKSPRSPSS